MHPVKRLDYILTPICKGRYKIEVKGGVFTRSDAKRIRGCYWSKTQQAWVMPQNEESLKQIRNLSSDSKVIINNKLERAVIKNNQDVKKDDRKDDDKKTGCNSSDFQIPKEFVETLK